MTRLAALSVDLDEIPCYAAIHGIEVSQAKAANAVYDRCVERFHDLFEELDVPATFFVIGSDLSRPDNVRHIRSLHDAGHEIANHTQNHRYDFSRLPRSEIANEVEQCMQTIGDAVGELPSGFRAPGYTVNDTVFEVLDEAGIAYDSSVFPCPAYFSAKAAAIAGIRLRGRRSHSIIDDPRVLSAPADPYRVGSPYWTRGAGLAELPIGVTRTATGRLPFIGTSVALAGPSVATVLTRAIIGRPLVNLELHGIDLSDAQRDGLQFLAPHQPDLRRTYAQKRETLAAVVRELRHAGYEFVCLAEAAQKLLS